MKKDKYIKVRTGAIHFQHISKGMKLIILFFILSLRMEYKYVWRKYVSIRTAFCPTRDCLHGT